MADRLIDRLAEIAEREPAEPPLIDAAEAARRLGVSRASVYELAAELGAIRIGSGSKPRLRFDPARIEAYRNSDAPEPAPPPRTKPKRRQSSSELLGIKRS